MNKQAWMDYAKKEGFTAFEIYQSSSKSTEMTWYRGKMDTFVTSDVTGTALRGVYNERMVNLATESPDDSAMEETIANMKEQAMAVTSEDEAIIRNPMDVTVTPANKAFKKPTEQQVKELLSTLEQKILGYDKRIIMVNRLAFEEETSTRSIVNTNGVNLSSETTAQMVVAEIAAAEGNVIKNDYSIDLVEDVTTYDQDAWVKKICDNVLAKLDGVSMSSGTYKTIFEKDAMTSLFTAFSGMFSGETISKGISPLKDSVGKKVFSDKISIVDDPQCRDALSAVDFDDEGCACTKKDVVRDGVFTTVLHNSRTAAKMHTESTGNGFKGGYASTVGVSMMNCCIVPGTKSLEDMCKDMGEGLVITELEGLHAGLNTVTGDFSLQCAGYYVKDGKRDHSIALITVAGNFLDMLNHVVEVGNDIDWKYKRIVTPSIAFEGCAISGE